MRILAFAVFLLAAVNAEEEEAAQTQQKGITKTPSGNKVIHANEEGVVTLKCFYNGTDAVTGQPIQVEWFRIDDGGEEVSSIQVQFTLRFSQPNRYHLHG